MAKNNDKIYWWLGIGAALWMLWGRTVNTIINLGFKLIGIQVVSLTQETTTLNLQIAIKNPTLHTLTLWAIKFNLSFNGEQIAVIDQAINRKIQGKEVTILNIQVTINNTETVNKLVEQLNSGIYDNWTIGLSGDVRVDNSYYPFSVVFFAEDLIPQLQQ